MSKSKPEIFKETYLNDKGESKLLDRDKILPELRWTSGDSIFRMDSGGSLSEYMYIYIYTNGKIKYSWEAKNLYEFVLQYRIKLFVKFIPEKYLKRIINDKNTYGVKFIKFYGKKSIKPVKDQGIREDIRQNICSRPCCVCYRTDNIECDHKNDLKNDDRVLVKSTQTLDDFQPLCKHCNMLKKSASQLRNKTNKRIGATRYGYGKDFISGDETLNKKDPNWHIGTYWGDVLKFKKSL